MADGKWMTGAALALLGQALCAAPPVPAPPVPAPMQPAPTQVRSVTELRDGWRFRKGGPDAASPEADDSGWEHVSVPHSWNRVGTYEAAAGVPGSAARKIDKYMGVGWYRLAFNSPPRRKDGRVWLEFGAASRTADVWLNGKRLGSHAGGFATFRFDATDALRPGKNVLAVKVDNSQPQLGGPTGSTLPLMGDFFVQGGLYRPVRMIETADAHFALDDFGGPGLYARTDAIEAGHADIAVLGRLTNQSRKALQGTMVVRALAADGSVAAEARRPVRLAPGAAGESRTALTVQAPHLWQGTSDPYLYTLEAELRDARGHVLDRQRQPLGIRQFRIDPDKGFFINGRHVALHGVGYHQDAMDSGWALSEAETAERFATIRDMGANTVRLTHYQHGPAIHDLADKHGLVLWDEIALVTAWTLDPRQGDAPADIRAEARQQVRELIRQNYNHPSVAVWGVDNEVDFGPSRPDFLGRGIKVSPVDPTPFIKELAALVANEDPQRPSTQATCCERDNVTDAPIVAPATAVVGANRYFGWYYGTPAELGPHLDQLHAKRPWQPQALTEYGAGGALSLHSDNPLGGPIDMGGRIQPEEYQSWLHEQSWPQIAARPHVWASWLWNSFDFATSTRTEGDAADINTKGLVSYDGKVRKDAFYYYRAQWSDQPTVHITGRRYRERAYPVTDVRVYSNAPATELLLNGRSLGSQADCANRTCLWSQVALAPGDNRIEAVGRFGAQETRDTLAWHLDPARAGTFRIDSGMVLTGGGWGSDAFFSGGTPGSADKRPRGRAPVLAALAPAALRDQLATYREGRFSYRIPAAPGRYRVTVHFVDPQTAPGERVFSVVAAGKVVVRNLDIARQAGKPLAAVSRSFAVKVANGPLVLDFVPSKGQAIVSAIEVVPEPGPR